MALQGTGIVSAVNKEKMSDDSTEAQKSMYTELLGTTVLLRGLITSEP